MYYIQSTSKFQGSQEALTPALLQLNRYSYNLSLPPTVVLAVVVVVEAALVVVPFLVPVTNSIWEGRQKKYEKLEKIKVLIYYSFCLFVLKKKHNTSVFKTSFSVT